MKILKNLLLWDSSKFIFLAVVVVVFTLSKTSYVAIVLLLVVLVYLYRVSKNLLIYSFILMIVLFIRFETFIKDDLPTSGKVVSTEDDRMMIASNGGYYYLYLDDASSFAIGMIVEFKGEKMVFDNQNIIGNFDYQTYLLSKNIKAQINVSEIKVLDKKFTLEMVPEVIENYIEDNYTGKSVDYLKLFILGQDDLDSDIIEKSRDIGISHLFAISGMHLSLIIGFISFLLNKVYLTKKTNQRIITIFLVIYNVITGFAISILRASLLTISLFYKNKDFTKTDYLSFIMIGFLIYNPYIIHNIGFVLSFIVSYSIILGRYLWSSKNKILQVLKIGILANLVSLPIILNLNGSFGAMNVFYNVFFVYFVSFIFLPISFILLASPHLSVFYEGVINFFEEAINFTHLANYYLEFSIGNEIFKTLYWVLLIGIFVFYHQNNRRYFLVGLLIVLFASVYGNYFIPLTYVRILDVNQAESIHLHNNLCDILIDTGNPDDYDNVINYLKKENIKELDFLVITHFHDDHEGEALDILNQIAVKNLVVNQYNQTYAKYPQIILKEQDKISCGDINLVNLNGYNEENENNNSLVLYGKIGIDYWLFSADIEKVVEERLIQDYNLDIDVLKVAHHGSETSTSKEFLEKFEIAFGLISVGPNSYKHPNQEVIERLTEQNIEIFRTDTEGTITFYYLPYLQVRIIETTIFNERAKYYLKN